MGKVFVFALLFILPLCVEARDIYLVSVGVADYKGNINDLKLSAYDAEAVHTLYTENFDANAVLLTNSNATRSNVLTKAENLFAKAKEDDIAVFFFSGHGYQGGFMAYDDKISYDDVRELFSSCKASNKMIFADACFAGDIREYKHSDSSTKQGVMLFLSSRGNEFSIEKPSMRNGLFTACLIRCLKGGADDNRDKVITAHELFAAVSKGVKELSQDRQHPVMWGSFSDDMIVMSWK